MKTNKLNLADLKIKSFVTDLDNEKSETAKGGGETFPCYSVYCSQGCPQSVGCNTSGPPRSFAGICDSNPFCMMK